MYYEWKVCNTKEICDHEFPELAKTVTLTNYYDQQYRLWETVNAVTIYQPGQYKFVLFKDQAGQTIQYGENNFLRLELQADGTYDVYHGQNG